MGDHTKMREPALWRREPDEVTGLLVGKLGEEAAELAQRCCRCLIQGVDGVDPDERTTNAVELAKEIADVYALIELVIPKLGLNTDFINERAAAKKAHKQRWLSGVAEQRMREVN